MMSAGAGAPARAHTHAKLAVDLAAGAAGGNQLVAAERVFGQALHAGRRLRDAFLLERVRERGAAAVGLEVQKGVADRQRQLVTERRRDVGGAVDEDVHGSLCRRLTLGDGFRE
jgi:hypothetical protein